MASELNFLTPYWAWSLPWWWHQKVPIMFFHRASMLTNMPKIHVYSLKTPDTRVWGLHFPTPYWAWSLPWRWYQNVPIMFFHRASMLTKIPKIHVYSFKTLDARASGLHFPTPSWAWSLPWRWYQKVPIMFFHRASMLTKIPKIHVYSFKALDARASGLHLATPSWAWSFPWGALYVSSWMGWRMVSGTGSWGTVWWVTVEVVGGWGGCWGSMGL